MSFRLRLFFLAAAIVGAVLAGVLLVGWNSIETFEISQLDGRLCLESRRLEGEPAHGRNMDRLEADLMTKLRLTRPDQLRIHINDDSSDNLDASSNWFKPSVLEAPVWQAYTEAPRTAPPGPPNISPPRARCELAGVASDGKDWRIARVIGERGSSHVAADLAATRAELQYVLHSAVMLVVPLALILTGAGAWLLSGLALRPINNLRDAMRTVSQQAFDRRLATDGADTEFKELITAYNEMLERLQTSFEQASRFSADAAHELKTPLTILRGRIENARRSIARVDIEVELDVLLDEVSRLAAITRKLLLLSQADAGRLALHSERIDMSNFLSDIVSDTRMLLDSQHLEASIEQSLEIYGDRVLLRQLINNVAGNAARYCPPGGWIRLQAERRASAVMITIANSCTPLDAATRTRLFDRFFRADPAHNRGIEGSGLGLSLARAIAHAHGGEIRLLDSVVDEIHLELRLPVICPSAEQECIS